ncbi:hypothetical protein ACE1CI_20110 [Aerosakkonemataceae cyanobacterium BLCC-F50]|uniref:Uncharacterized protein n=1 Tax=Floridaenema flaviceps BLCC-F50 TaxID=3153642 RepID=A0ABV4XWD1_9CYAN
MDLAQRIIKYMTDKDYRISTEPGQVNIVYIEGVNPDGTINADRLDEWNDLRIVITFQFGNPVIVGKYIATTEPGRKYTMQPMNRNGAARIQFGQYKAWRVGTHGGSQPHEALVQVTPVSVCRDLNKDGVRTGDKVHTGLFGINQHWGYDMKNVGAASAGCLVGQSRESHRQFMGWVKADPRYRTDRNYIFRTTIIAGDKL